MNTKRIMTLLLIPFISIAFSVSAAWAGSAQRHRVEGAVIGIGALLLTQAIINHHDAYAVDSTSNLRKHHHHRAGHWDTQKKWVPAQYKKVWNPGHYDRRGRWVRGHWTQLLIKPGYWVEEKVWVSYR